MKSICCPQMGPRPMMVTYWRKHAASFMFVGSVTQELTLPVVLGQRVPADMLHRGRSNSKKATQRLVRQVWATPAALAQTFFLIFILWEIHPAPRTATQQHYVSPGMPVS